jgi:hypothetical protein
MWWLAGASGCLALPVRVPRCSSPAGTLFAKGMFDAVDGFRERVSTIHDQLVVQIGPSRSLMSREREEVEVVPKHDDFMRF